MKHTIDPVAVSLLENCRLGRIMNMVAESPNQCQNSDKRKEIISQEIIFCPNP